MSAAFIGGRVFSPITLLTRAGFGYCVNQKCQIMTWAKGIWLWRLTCVRLTCAFYLGALCVIHMCEFYMWKGSYSFNANLASFENLWCGKINQIKPKVIICVKQSNVFFWKNNQCFQRDHHLWKKKFFSRHFGAVLVQFWKGGASCTTKRCKLHQNCTTAPKLDQNGTKTAPWLLHFFNISKLFFSHCGEVLGFWKDCVQILWNCWKNFVCIFIFIYGIVSDMCHHFCETYLWILLGSVLCAPYFWGLRGLHLKFTCGYFTSKGHCG